MLGQPLTIFVPLLLGLLFGSGLIKGTFAVGVRPLLSLLPLSAADLSLRPCLVGKQRRQHREQHDDQQQDGVNRFEAAMFV